MSRCFPYPPPGYTLSSVKSEALIESIKLQKEKLRKKEKRREKKEKRKERKERKKGKTEKKDEFFPKSRFVESEQFEHSSLTEEHGHPDSLPVPTLSYDSSENSNKRKRHSFPEDGSLGHGKPMLIRLTSKMQSDFDALANGQQLRSVSGGTGSLTQHKADIGLRNRTENFCCTLEGTNNTGQCFTPRNNREEICSTSGQIETLAPGRTESVSTPCAVVSSLQGVNMQYENLLANWFPPLIQDASLYPVDFDWLSQDTWNQDPRTQKRHKSGIDSVSYSRSSALWPRAEYVHEVDAYALPFVVPY